MAIAIRSDRESGNSLIYKAAHGDLEAFNEIVLFYRHIAYNHAYSLTGDPDTADDITQESFIKAYRKLDGFRGGSFRAWLLKIVTNTCYDQLRKSRRNSTPIVTPVNEDGDEMESPTWLINPAASIQMTVEQKEEIKCLYRILDAMPVSYRSVITLVDLLEINYKDAAQILKVPLGTIKSRLARARLLIRKSFLEMR